ncbi:MAG: DUF488 domain-containing protein [Candidatus Micrarchaeia archaeon]
MPSIKVKRVYDKREVTDGARILVDRLWPRGVRHDGSKVDIWFKNIAPSTELRKWFSHEVEKWPEFRERYIKELEQNPSIDKFISIIKDNGTVTFLYASSDTEHNNALVLKEFIDKKLKDIGEDSKKP